MSLGCWRRYRTAPSPSHFVTIPNVLRTEHSLPRTQWAHISSVKLRGETSHSWPRENLRSAAPVGTRAISGHECDREAFWEKRPRALLLNGIPS